jgi:hypothetical protein
MRLERYRYKSCGDRRKIKPVKSREATHTFHRPMVLPGWTGIAGAAPMALALFANSNPGLAA